MIQLEDVYSTTGSRKFLYDLLRERSEEKDAHVNISHRTLPSWEDHIAFVHSKPYWCWQLIRVNGAWVGYLSITDRNEIGIVLKRAHRGQGIGKAALNELLKQFNPLPAVPSKRQGCFLANINPQNQASIRLFQRMGFRHIQNTYALEE